MQPDSSFLLHGEPFVWEARAGECFCEVESLSGDHVHRWVWGVDDLLSMLRRTLASQLGGTQSDVRLCALLRELEEGRRAHA